MQKIIRKICSKIEQMSIPRVNWIKTLYFNFRLLPFKEAKKIPFFIYCWACNSTSINAGAIIPKHSINSSHSLVNKDVSQWGDHILIGGTPVKLLKKGIARVFNVKNELCLFQLSQQSELDSFCIPQHIDIHNFIKFEDDVVL